MKVVDASRFSGATIRLQPGTKGYGDDILLTEWLFLSHLVFRRGPDELGRNNGVRSIGLVAQIRVWPGRFSVPNTIMMGIHQAQRSSSPPPSSSLAACAPTIRSNAIQDVASPTQAVRPAPLPLRPDHLPLAGQDSLRGLYSLPTQASPQPPHAAPMSAHGEPVEPLPTPATPSDRDHPRSIRWTDLTPLPQVELTLTWRATRIRKRSTKSPCRL